MHCSRATSVDGVGPVRSISRKTMLEMEGVLFETYLWGGRSRRRDVFMPPVLDSGAMFISSESILASVKCGRGAPQVCDLLERFSLENGVWRGSELFLCRQGIRILGNLLAS